MTAGEQFAAALRAAQAAARTAAHEEVLRWSEGALACVSDSTPPEDLSELSFLRADSLRHLGRWAEAAEEFRALCAREADLGVTARHCRARRLLAELARRRRDYPEALRSCFAAIDLAAQLDDPVGVLLSRVPLARVYSDVGRRQDAEALIRGVLNAAQALPDSPGRSLVLVSASTVLSLLQFRRQQLREAQATLAGVAEHARRVTHAITLAAYHRQVAIVHEVQLSFSTAIRHLNHALTLYDTVRYEPGRYDVYWSLALSYTNMGDLRTARLCLDQCIAVAQRHDLRLELAKSKSSYGELAVREGDYEEALRLFREDLLLSREIGDQQALGHCNRKIADCYRMMGDLAHAETHAAASVRNFEAMSRQPEANLVRILLGRVLVAAGRPDDAEQCLEQSRSAIGGEGRPADRAAVLRLEALVAQSHGDLAHAVNAFEASLELQDARQPTRELAETCFEAGLAYRDRGDLESAKRCFARAVDAAGMLGSRDLWERVLAELRQIDIMAAQRLMLKPYLPGRAVEELSGGWTEPRLAVATMMFVDMRGATALSGTLPPIELSEVVDAFLGPVVRILLRWQGTVDKFIGDCVVAVFGLQDGSSGANAAVRAGLEIIEYMEATKAIRERAGASVMEATIGINTGEVAAGCFGPLLRRDYTVLGYHVNLAQRLQGVAGLVPSERGTRMVISGTTYEELTEPIDVEPIDLSHVTLKGIAVDEVTAYLVRPDRYLGEPERPSGRE